MATKQIQERWFRNAPGRPMDPDHVWGLQCVDPPKDYSATIFGKTWQETVGAGNAEDMFAGSSNKYFSKILNNPDRPGLIPRRGDIIIWGGTPANGLNPYGHIAVVLSANQNGVTVLQQDGFLRVPCFKATLGYWNDGTGMVTGWIRPRPSRVLGGKKKDPAPKLKSYQRVVGKLANVAYRKHASSNAKLVQWLEADHKYDFKGYVHGEPVKMGNGKTNDIWFVGKYTGGFAWSGAFTSQSTKGLKNLTPKKPSEPELAPYQRTTGKVAVSYRTGPSTAFDLTSASDGMLAPDHVFDFDAWTHGQPVTDTDTGKKNDVWFRGRYSKGWAWSGGFLNQSTGGLKKVEAKQNPDPGEDTAPPVPEKYEFKADLDCITAVRPARVGHFQADGMPDVVRKSIEHQFGEKANHRGDTIDGVVAWFQSEENEGLTSAHIVVQDEQIIQMVALKDRAYHGGAGGNDFYGIEIDPTMSAATVLSVRKILRELAEREGRALELILHRSVAATECGKDIDLTLFSEFALPNGDPAVQDPTVVIPEDEKPEEAPEDRPEPPADDSASTVFDWLERFDWADAFKNRDKASK